MVLLTTLKHFIFFSEIQSLTLKLSVMATSNSPIAEIIPTLETIYSCRTLFRHLGTQKSGSKAQRDYYCARHIFNKPQTIYPELIMTFWRNAKFVNKKMIASKVLGVEVVLSNDSIAKATRCLHEGSTYQEGWEKNYESHITRELYRENDEKASDKKTTTWCARKQIFGPIFWIKVFSTKQVLKQFC